MVVSIPYYLVSHTRRICNLYKRWLRNLERIHVYRHDYRYAAVLARVPFEKLMNEKDMIKAKQKIEEMEEDLYQNQHPQQLRFPTSPGGVAYGRYTDPPDYVLDYWHPLEKSAYPKYFQRRELRKQQYVEMWEKEYGCKEKSKK
ncbi:UNVERIFIED_CONTAM: hypothetical protein PYX00_004840 [Menopon gallinae]|uniref:NADH dehydrogenase [ubiquinone] 1 beta subcomplex subunit 9 n=1 Tax=Menopon gallinae TaxID=328185 RepID=A0AAW2I683_9NEOP